MGRRPKPAVLRELHGNPGKRRARVDEPEGVGDLWAPPSWFDDDQRDQWSYAVDHAPPGLLTGTDREILAIWCVASVEYARAAREVRAGGQVVQTKAGNAIINPYLSIVNRQAVLMAKAGSELGFSPAARAALGVHAPAFPNGAVGAGRRTLKGDLARYLERKPDRLDDDGGDA